MNSINLVFYKKEKDMEKISHNKPFKRTVRTNDLSIEHLINYVEIYQDQQHAFKSIFSLGIILQNRETGDYRHITSYTFNVVLHSPMCIYLRRLRELQIQSGY